MCLYVRSHGPAFAQCSHFARLPLREGVGPMDLISRTVADWLQEDAAERRTPCRFVGNLTFPSLFLGEDGRL